jgi:hypothetical protein
MEGIQDYMQQKAVVDINPEGHALLMIQLFGSTCFKAPTSSLYQYQPFSSC